ncbi:MAG TPA: hypothetical protein VK426_03775 [Methanobacterium sp.]|nr:hypothetical protein [Methanobacterium sp.]
MDDKGFIFTSDAVLALIIVVVLTGTITAYAALPIYPGNDHEHLEAIASSALEVMEQDGTLNSAAVDVATNNSNAARNNLTARLNSLIPAGISYRMTITDVNTLNPPAENDSSGSAFSSNVATKVKVISAPNQGWFGRSWYKVENFTFVTQPQNVTSTVWNFHNWLSNFAPWSGGNALQSYPYWGSGSSAQNIPFSVPDGTFRSAKFLVGDDSYSAGTSAGGDFVLNGGAAIHYNPNQATFIGPRSNDANQFMWNYQGNISSLNMNTTNNFYIKFTNMTAHKYDLPWASVIASYTTNIVVPQGILFNSSANFQDAAGLAVQNPTNLTGGNSTNQYQLIYNINNGTVSGRTTSRVVTWANFYNKNVNDSSGNPIDNGVPFVITNVNYSGVTATKTAVSVTQDVPPLPAGSKVLDTFVNVNAWGAVDGALVEVWNGTDWTTVFNSFDIDGKDYSAVSSGYGNIPGIVYIPYWKNNDPTTLKQNIVPGANNKVRITVWDDVPGGDYDLVGLTDCYITTSYTKLNVGWDNTPFDSHQSSTSTETQTKSFNVSTGSSQVYLFLGTGMDTQNITVKYDNSHVLYSGSDQYYLDLAALDAQKGYHYITTANSTGTNYVITPASNVNLTVSVNAPTSGWQSGDINAELFSGTRIAVIYPALYNLWYEGFASNASAAKDVAYNNLTGYLNTTVGRPPAYDPANIQKQAIWVGDLPNQATVRLDLWTH